MRFVGCYTSSTAKLWSERIIRSGHSPENNDPGRAFGTARYVQVIQGQGGRLLGRLNALRVRVNPRHPGIEVPFVPYGNQVFQQNGWDEWQDGRKVGS